MQSVPAQTESCLSDSALYSLDAAAPLLHRKHLVYTLSFDELLCGALVPENRRPKPSKPARYRREWVQTDRSLTRPYFTWMKIALLEVTGDCGIEILGRKFHDERLHLPGTSIHMS